MSRLYLCADDQKYKNQTQLKYDNRHGQLWMTFAFFLLPDFIHLFGSHQRTSLTIVVRGLMWVSITTTWVGNSYFDNFKSRFSNHQIRPYGLNSNRNIFNYRVRLIIFINVILLFLISTIHYYRVSIGKGTKMMTIRINSRVLMALAAT